MSWIVSEVQLQPCFRLTSVNSVNLCSLAVSLVPTQSFTLTTSLTGSSGMVSSASMIFSDTFSVNVVKS